MAKIPLFERRLEPSESPAVIAGVTLASILLALVIGGFLFLPFNANPLDAYLTMLEQGFGHLNGFGFHIG